jgi:hypothetical protein
MILDDDTHELEDLRRQDRIARQQFNHSLRHYDYRDPDFIDFEDFDQNYEADDDTYDR